MKKLFSKLIPAVVSIMLLSTGTAFAAQDAEARAVYDEMEAKSSSMTDGNISCHMDLVSGDGTSTINMGMDMNMLYKNMLDPDQMEYMNQSVITFNGTQTPMNSWYKDGYLYTESAGQKVKMKMDMANAMKSAMGLSSTFGTSSDLLSSVSLSTEGDKRVLSYTMDESKLGSYMDQIISQLGMGELSSGLQIKIYNVGGTYTLTPDNNFTDATISMAMDMNVNGEKLTVTINGVMTLVNPGQPVEFTLPSPDGYTDASL